MKYLTKLALGNAATIAIMLPLAAPTAAERSQEIVVKSKGAMEDWQAETTKDLNRALARVPLARKVQPNNAIVQVAFTLGADGKASDIQVLDGRGNWAARKTAAHAVRQLDDLASVPVTNPQKAKFVANVIFASTPRKRDELAATLWKSEAGRMAAAKDAENTIMLGG